MAEKRSKKPQRAPNRSQRNGKRRVQKRAPAPKKLDAKTRRRNRRILYAVITSIILFTFYKCSGDDTKKVVAEQNSSIENNNSQIETNNTKEEKSNKTDRTQEEKKENNLTKILNSKTLSTDTTLAKQQLLEKYRKKRSYSSAMALSEYFYSQKSYKKAIEWAIVANKEDNQKERSWQIYAKSKIALGDAKKAKQALEAYLKDNRSESLEKLLKSIKKEEK